MDRRDFIKKATMAAATAAVVSPVSAMINTVTGKQCKVLLINGSPRTDGNTFCCLQEIETTLQKIHADGDAAPKRDERPQFMNFIR